MTLDDLISHHEIREVLAKYCRGADRGEAELIASAFHSDAQDDHGPFKGPSHDFADYIVERYDAMGIIGQHHLTNIYIELRGDRAVSECYFISLTPDAAMRAADGIRLVTGRYLDDFEKRNGKWKIAKRRVIIDWSQAHEDGTPWERLQHYLRGARREQDPTASVFSTQL